jgi:P protein
METNVNASLPVAIGYDVSPIDESDGTVYAVVVLVGLYVLIIFEAKIHEAKNFTF